MSVLNTETHNGLSMPSLQKPPFGNLQKKSLL